MTKETAIKILRKFANWERIDADQYPIHRDRHLNNAQAFEMGAEALMDADEDDGR